MGRRWCGLVGRWWRDRRWLVWFDAGLGLMVGRWVSWMAWVGGSTMAWVSGSVMAWSAMAGLVWRWSGFGGGSVGFMDGVGQWVSWMAWVSGSAMAGVSGSAMAWSAMAGLVRQWSWFDGGFYASWTCFFSLSIKLRWWVWWWSRVLAQRSWSQAQIYWIFGSGCGWSWLASCCWVVVLWQWLWIVPFVVFFFFVVCIILLEWIYYFIVVDILFYYDVYIILLC